MLNFVLAVGLEQQLHQEQGKARILLPAGRDCAISLITTAPMSRVVTDQVRGTHHHVSSAGRGLRISPMAAGIAQRLDRPHTHVRHHHGALPQRASRPGSSDGLGEFCAGSVRIGAAAGFRTHIGHFPVTCCGPEQQRTARTASQFFQLVTAAIRGKMCDRTEWLSTPSYKRSVMPPSSVTGSFDTNLLLEAIPVENSRSPLLLSATFLP